MQRRSARGELRLEVHDAHGAGVAPSGGLVSEGNQFYRAFQVLADGHYVAQGLPFGAYRLSLGAEAFAPWSNLVEIRSEVPMRASITPGVAPHLRNRLNVINFANFFFEEQRSLRRGAFRRA